MRITTWNVNGLRAAIRKGFAEHLERLDPTVLLLQEIRVLPEQLPKKWAEPEGWHVHWNPAEKKGYAGTAIWSRVPFELLGTGMDAHDPEGRIVRVRVEGTQILSVYLPSGSSSEERQARKEAWMDDFAAWLRPLAAGDEAVVLGGDLNIAHTEADIHNPRGNAKNSGFLPHEREWFTRLLDAGWTDTLRAHVGEQQGPYSWWSNRGRARELDRGWRIDYLLANAATPKVSKAWIDRRGGLEVSDHAPVTIELEK